LGLDMGWVVINDLGGRVGVGIGMGNDWGCHWGVI